MKRPLYSVIALPIFLFIILSVSTMAQTLAFPGAEGFGKYTTGGRGGTVFEVTSLADNGPGTLRQALENTTGPRTIVFRVSGTIELQSGLRIKQGDVTIAGQTAPGDGITIKNYPVRLDANNVILRFIRFRLGDEDQQAEDSFWGRECKNIIIDHCTMSWSIDESASLYDNTNFSMQWCIISESLNNSYHPKGAHGYGGIWGGAGATFHHNLLAHHTSRNPRFNGSRYTTTPETELVDFVNNVIYNWGFNSAYAGESGRYNMRNNYYKYGPATEYDVRSRIIEPYDDYSYWYIDGNYIYGNIHVTADNWNGGVQGSHADAAAELRPESPHEVVEIEMETAEEAFESVLKHAGCFVPVRDSIDARIVEETRTGTAHYGQNGIIDSQTQVGGYLSLQSTPPPADNDHDGMADDWETNNGLDPTDASDRNNVDSLGYTMLENYLNYLVEQGMLTDIEDDGFLTDDLVVTDYANISNYPNPFNAQTVFNYTLPEDSKISIDIYSVLGEKISNIYQGFETKGKHQLPFNFGNGKTMPSGIYFVTLNHTKGQAVTKIMYLK